METILHMPPWGAPDPTRELMEAIGIIDRGTTAIAKTNFNYSVQALEESGRPARKGMQADINAVLDANFKRAGWDVKDGRFLKNGTYVRVTFRHAMSMGSDILDAMKLVSKREVKLVVLMACGQEDLKRIAPSQAASMVSYEKLEEEIRGLDGVISIPLMIGKLIPRSI